MAPPYDSPNMHLDHVGVATDDAAQLADLFTDLFGASIEHEEEFEAMGVVFVELGDSYLELLEPLGDEGVIADFLDRNGPGIHHVAFAAEDLEESLGRARALGVDLIDEEPRPGAWDHDVAFLHPSSTGGVLVEFVEH